MKKQSIKQVLLPREKGKKARNDHTTDIKEQEPCVLGLDQRIARPKKAK